VKEGRKFVNIKYRKYLWGILSLKKVIICQ
jgi:hypothetical protein